MFANNAFMPIIHIKIYVCQPGSICSTYIQWSGVLALTCFLQILATDIFGLAHEGEVWMLLASPGSDICIIAIIAEAYITSRNTEPRCNNRLRQYAVKCRYSTIIFLQMLTTGIPWLAHEGEAWGVVHEFRIWPLCYCHYCSRVYNIAKN